MFHHVVLMKFRESADAAFFDRVEKYAEELRRVTPNMHRYVFKQNIASRADGLTHGIIATFESSADHDGYQVSPVHVEMRDYMAPVIERIVVCDIDEEGR